MVQQYKQVCKRIGLQSKVFTKKKQAISRADRKSRMPSSFTNTVSHQMVKSAVTEAEKSKCRCDPLSYER